MITPSEKNQIDLAMAEIETFRTPLPKDSREWEAYTRCLTVLALAMKGVLGPERTEPPC